jgi:hypothetical protein
MGDSVEDRTQDPQAHHQQVHQPHDPASARIRNLVIDRLLRMNARHATHAWLKRRIQPVGPHGIAFLYCEQVPDAARLWHRVAAATRLVDDGDDVRDLPRLLYRLSTLARERYAPESGGFDPLTHMTNRHDPMSDSASYIGAGVSSLDTEPASWEQTQRTANGPLDIPGRCFVLLRDSSAILIERGAQDVFREVQVYSTHDLNVEPGMSTRRWVWKPDLPTLPATAEIWRQLYDLHAVAMPRPPYRDGAPRTSP